MSKIWVPKLKINYWFYWKSTFDFQKKYINIESIPQVYNLSINFDNNEFDNKYTNLKVYFRYGSKSENKFIN